MSTFTIKAKQQQRIDTAANWVTKNPVLLVGELGIESDTGKIKVGNGVAVWNSLAYIGITTEYLEANYVKKTGTAASATKLATARSIGLSGVTATAKNFDGTAAIVIPITAVPATLLTGTASIPTTGNAGSATKLQTARTIGLSGVTATAQSFNGTANIVIPITAVPTSLLSGNIDASRITVAANANLGNNTNLASVLTYIANVFAGSQSVTKIKAGTFDTTT
jgi:hypothetical protein